jgi:hypothetical protein
MSVYDNEVSNDANRKGACLSDSLPYRLKTNEAAKKMLRNSVVKDRLSKASKPNGVLIVSDNYEEDCENE